MSVLWNSAHDVLAGFATELPELLLMFAIAAAASANAAKLLRENGAAIDDGGELVNTPPLPPPTATEVVVEVVSARMFAGSDKPMASARMIASFFIEMRCCWFDCVVVGFWFC